LSVLIPGTFEVAMRSSTIYWPSSCRASTCCWPGGVNLAKKRNAGVAHSPKFPLALGFILWSPWHCPGQFLLPPSAIRVFILLGKGCTPDDYLPGFGTKVPRTSIWLRIREIAEGNSFGGFGLRRKEC